MYSKTLKNVVYPLIQIRYPKDEDFLTYLRVFEKTQWYTAEKLKKIQLQKLRHLVTYAYDNVPYYHKMFTKLKLKPDDIKTINDLKKLPILTKNIIRNNLEDLKSKNFPRRIIPYWTSGSTGEPMKFFIDKKRTASTMAAAYRQWSWAGYRIGDKISYLWAAPHDLSNQAKLNYKLTNLLERKIFFDAFSLDEKRIISYIEQLRRLKTKFINAYSSAIYLIALYMEKRNISDIRPTAILTSVDVLFDYQRKTIEKVFGCEVFDYYSGRDTSLQAGECPEHSGYHLSSENAIVEFIKNGNNVAAGEKGRIIITDLSVYAMPFIRYDIGDMGILSDERCPCGRGLPLMKSLEGRVSDQLRRTDGGYITGACLTFALKDFENLLQIQIIQKTKEKIVLKVVKGERYTNKDSKSLIKLMKSYLGEEMNIEIQFTDTIPPTRSGKRRYAISEIDIEI